MKLEKLPPILRHVTEHRPLTKGELFLIEQEIDQLSATIEDENSSDGAIDRACDRLDVIVEYLEHSQKIARFKERGLRLVG